MKRLKVKGWMLVNMANEIVTWTNKANTGKEILFSTRDEAVLYASKFKNVRIARVTIKEKRKT